MIGAALLVAALGAPQGTLEIGVDAWSYRDVLEEAAERRRTEGIGLSATGAVAAALGASLMIGEYVVRPRPGDVRVWRLEGCWISFIAGSMLVPFGVHALVAGIALLARSRTLAAVADVVLVEGPGSWWDAWYGKAKHLRITGTVLMTVGSAFLAGSLMSMLPYATCNRWECDAWPEHGTWSGVKGGSSFPAFVSLAAVSAVAYSIGLGMMIGGYAMQHDLLENRHLIDSKPRILLTFSPAGLALAW